jgi:hypothetical protein
MNLKLQARLLLLFAHIYIINEALATIIKEEEKISSFGLEPSPTPSSSPVSALNVQRLWPRQNCEGKSIPNLDAD